MRAYRVLTGALLIAIALSLTACPEKGPAERAGEKVDNAVKSAGDKVEDAGDKVKDAVH